MAAPTPPSAWLTKADEADALVLRARGHWDVGSVAALEDELRHMKLAAGRPIRIDMGGIEALDTDGAWILYRSARARRGAAPVTKPSSAARGPSIPSYLAFPR